MRLTRHVVARKNQWLVAIPAEVRQHLALVPGASVYWHISQRGRVALTVSGKLSGGAARQDADCPSCAKYRAELDRLRHELREGEAATPGQWFRQALASTERALFWDLAELAAWARSQRTKQRQGGQRSERRPRPAQESRGAAQPRTSNPRPDPPPSESSGGADASGAASPQASQPEITVQHL